MNWILNLAQEKRCGTHLDTVVKPFVVSLGDSKSPSKNWYEIIALLVDGR